MAYVVSSCGRNAMNKLKYAHRDCAEIEKTILQGQELLKIYKKTVDKKELALNNKPDSPFYGLKHMTKFQTLKYIADSFDISDDIVDNIYKKLKQQQLWKHIGRFSTEGVAGEWFKIPHRIRAYMTRPTRDYIQIYNRNQYPPHRILTDERTDLGRRWFVLKIDKDIGIMYFTGCNYHTAEYVQILSHGHCFKLKDLLKKDLQQICQDKGILFKKSWTKKTLVQELVK